MVEEKYVKYGQLSGIFTPGAPVAKRDRFAGRVDQILEIINAMTQPGKHVILYGERGVGKTSLANVLAEFLEPFYKERRPVVRVNCTSQDTFRTMWAKVFREMQVDITEEWGVGSVDPDAVRRILAQLSPARLVILDEFDRVVDDYALSLMADTIKALSDHTVATKLVIVGVADSIDNLIGEHESVQRAIEEVQLRRMAPKELVSIIDTGLAIVDMSITPDARRAISRLAEGLPHYVHLLTLAAAQRAVMDDRTKVGTTDVKEAIKQATQKHSVLREFQTAIQSPRRDNLFARVLIACALAEKNPLGHFTAGAVREPMSRIMGRPYDIPAFAPHLKAFTEAERGSVLRRDGVERRYTYRFRNPLLQPFAVLAAISDGILPPEYVDDIFGR